MVTNSPKVDAKKKSFLPGNRKGCPYAGDVLILFQITHCLSVYTDASA